MAMLGINCDCRMSWNRDGDGRFSFVNEKRTANGSWAYIDQWRFIRKI
jgi:hypothetical protein